MPLQARSRFIASSPVAGREMLFVRWPGNDDSLGLGGGGGFFPHQFHHTWSLPTSLVTLFWSQVNHTSPVSANTPHLIAFQYILDSLFVYKCALVHFEYSQDNEE